MHKSWTSLNFSIITWKPSLPLPSATTASNFWTHNILIQVLLILNTKKSMHHYWQINLRIAGIFYLLIIFKVYWNCSFFKISLVTILCLTDKQLIIQHFNLFKKIKTNFKYNFYWKNYIVLKTYKIILMINEIR